MGSYKQFPRDNWNMFALALKEALKQKTLDDMAYFHSMGIFHENDDLTQENINEKLNLQFIEVNGKPPSKGDIIRFVTSTNTTKNYYKLQSGWIDLGYNWELILPILSVEDRRKIDNLPYKEGPGIILSGENNDSIEVDLRTAVERNEISVVDEQTQESNTIIQTSIGKIILGKNITLDGNVLNCGGDVDIEYEEFDDDDIADMFKND